MRDLRELRVEIDEIDRKITELYKRRTDIAGEVAEYKKKSGKPVFDQAREEEKLSVLSALGETPFQKDSIHELFQQIMAVSRKRQYQLLAEAGAFVGTGFVLVDALCGSKEHVVFQGAEGAYTQLALKEYFKDGVCSYHVDTWRDAMEELAQGRAAYAVLPVENSSAGIIPEIYDLLVEYGHCIVGEQVLRIDHALLGLPEAQYSDITDVYSHPQALAQCDAYLREHAAWEVHSMKNTAMAAQKIKADGRKNAAAIASPQNAGLYGLKVLDAAIQDQKLNATRFLILTNRRVFVKEAQKISICFEAPHKSGALYQMLSHFIYNGLNLNHIESRPIPDKNWEYRFFVEFDGNLNDAAVESALFGLSQEAISLKILGNY